MTDKPLYYVDPEIMSKRRWVNDYIHTLDPDKDYARIMSIIGMYQQDEFTLGMFIATSSAYVVMPAHGAEAVLFTNNFIRRPNLRRHNTLSFFWTWFANGPSHPDSVEATQRLNHIHQRIAKHLPGHFDIDSDYIYTLALFTTIQNRLAVRLGLGEVSPLVKKATYNYFRDISKNIRKGNNEPLEGYPESYEACEAYCYDWERWDHRMSVPQQTLIRAFLDQFVAAYFPRPLQWLGQWMMLYTIEDHLLEHYRIEPLRGLKRFFTHNVLKTILYIKTNLASDEKVPFIDRRHTPSRDELAKQDKKSHARADRKGFTEGGKEAIYVTEGAHSVSACPIMNGNFDISQLPDPVREQLERVTASGRMEYDEFKENDEFEPAE